MVSTCNLPTNPIYAWFIGESILPTVQTDVLLTCYRYPKYPLAFLRIPHRCHDAFGSFGSGRSWKSDPLSSGTPEDWCFGTANKRRTIKRNAQKAYGAMVIGLSKSISRTMFCYLLLCQKPFELLGRVKLQWNSPITLYTVIQYGKFRLFMHQC